MYSKILVPLAMDEAHDPSIAIGIATRLAASGAEIVLCHVVEHMPAYAVNYIEPDAVAALRDGLTAELDKLAAEVPGGRGLLVEGHGGRTLVNVASSMNADLVVIHSHRPVMSDYILGSTAAHVVRHCPSAVHVIR